MTREEVWENLYVAAKEVVFDFDTYGEVIQLDNNGEYGPVTAIEKLRTAIENVDTWEPKTQETV